MVWLHTGLPLGTTLPARRARMNRSQSHWRVRRGSVGQQGPSPGCRLRDRAAWDVVRKLCGPKHGRPNMPLMSCNRSQLRSHSLATGHTTNTGLPCSADTIRIGVTRSVSFEMTTAASNDFFHASLTRCTARFTSDPFSSIVWTSDTTASGCGRVRLRLFFAPLVGGLYVPTGSFRVVGPETE